MNDECGHLITVYYICVCRLLCLVRALEHNQCVFIWWCRAASLCLDMQPYRVYHSLCHWKPGKARIKTVSSPKKENSVITAFLGLERRRTLLSMGGQKALGFHKTYLNLCSKYEQRSYGFGNTRGWVINDRRFIFAWTIHLSSVPKPGQLPRPGANKLETNILLINIQI